MSESYIIEFADGVPRFKAGGNVPEWAMKVGLASGAIPAGTTIACRMGDPDLLHCAVFYQGNGGFFCVYGKDGLLFVAQAMTNLDFALAQGFFGEMTANARYGVDVFENMEIPDD